MNTLFMRLRFSKQKPSPIFWIFAATLLSAAERVAQVTQTSERQVTIAYRLADFKLDTVQINGASAVRPVFENAVSLHTPGAPQLPTRVFVVGVPAGARAEVSVIPGASEELPEIFVPPVPVQERVDDQIKWRYTLDLQIYERDAFYPAELARVDPPAQFRKQTIVRVQAMPVQYNPVKRQLQIYRELPRHINAPRPQGLVENAIYVSDGGDARIDDNDFILLYGRGVEGFAFDSTSGAVIYPLGALAEGRHTVEIKAWDNLNNSSSALAEFVVLPQDRLVLREVMNYPNPFRNRTAFTFELNLEAEVRVKIFTLSGRLIRTLEMPEARPGFNLLEWDGRDEDGAELANGVYLYKIIATQRQNENTLRAEEISKLVVQR